MRPLALLFNSSLVLMTFRQLGAAALGLLLLTTPALAQEGDGPTIVQLAVDTDALSTLETAVIAADLVDALSAAGPITVFAPTNGAFGDLPEGTVASLVEPENKAQLRSILKYHVVAGKLTAADLSDGQMLETLTGDMLTVSITDAGVMINGAKVARADVMASNGVVHVIDGVLLPPTDGEPMAGDADTMPETSMGGGTSATIVDLAVNTEALSTLVAAVQAADLVDALNGAGPITVFAPTNGAFGALPEGTVETLTQPENQDTLRGILTYHVVAGKLTAADLTDGQMLETLTGDMLTVSITDAGVMINGAKVAQADVMASNGVVHVIDGVLLPPTDDAGSDSME
ncbi:MAG: fasciclin domain-containing protein [Bacteroidota bacterium]